MEWNKVSEKEMPFGKEVIAFNEKWIDEDFNLNGTRVGFMQDDGFVSATWNNEQDCYDTCSMCGRVCDVAYEQYLSNYNKK